MKKALIIFVRVPELGKVKTRLAKTLGDAKALEIYTEMLLHTRDVTRDLSVDKFVFYAGSPNALSDSIWDRDNFSMKPQTDGDLGEKMKNAFESMFAKGYHSVCIIGSDCISLTPHDLADAFVMLERNDLVLGPSTDGGYYLLGMKKVFNEVFCNKVWSTETVLAATLEDVSAAGKSYDLLRKLTDIDTEDDWNQHKNLKS